MHLRFASVVGVSLLATAACAPQFDLVIKNGDLVDGTGAPAGRADVAVRGDRIVAVGAASGRARRTIDATGHVVAPGFIDVQGQSGVTLLVDANGESHIRQGITTEIIGEGSTPALWTRDTVDRVALDRYHLQYDWTGFDGYLHALQNRGTSINLGSFAPVAAIREQVLGMQNRTPTPEELQREQEILDRAMQQGAFGFATALIYPPASYTPTEELVALAGGTNLPATLPGWAQEGGREKMLERLKNPAERAKMRRDVEANTEVENLLAGATFDGIQIASVPPDKDQSIVGKRLSQIAAERH